MLIWHTGLYIRIRSPRLCLASTMPFYCGTGAFQPRILRQPNTTSCQSSPRQSLLGAQSQAEPACNGEIRKPLSVSALPASGAMAASSSQRLAEPAPTTRQPASSASARASRHSRRRADSSHRVRPVTQSCRSSILRSIRAVVSAVEVMAGDLTGADRWRAKLPTPRRRSMPATSLVIRHRSPVPDRAPRIQGSGHRMWTLPSPNGQWRLSERSLSFGR